MSLFVVSGVSKKYGKGASACLALDNINLSFPNNGVFAIEGKSGSGKSTLLNILFGIEKPTTGRVNFNGEDFTSLTSKKMQFYHQHEIAMVFQHYNLFDDLTAFENVILPLLIRGDDFDSAKAKTLQIFTQFHLTDVKDRKVGTFSGGEKQRIAILRAVVTSPKAILLDEPTGALDYENSTMIMELVKELSLNCLIIFVSHNKEIIDQYADTIITLQDGKIVSKTEKNEIKDIKKPISNLKKSFKNQWWKKRFLKLHLSVNNSKNILSMISITVGITSVILALGFMHGSESSVDEVENKTVLSQYATVARKSYYEIDTSPLKYEKSTRPEFEETQYLLSELDNIHLDINFDYLFSPTPFGKYEGEEVTGFSLSPVYDIRQFPYTNLLAENKIDTFSDFHDVIVNEEFLKLIKVAKKECLDKEFEIDYETTTSYQTGDIEEPIIKDNFSYVYKLRIIGVVKEFAFLNMPRIYYSYVDVKNMLGTVVIDNLSTYLKKDITYLDKIYDSSGDSEISSYSWNLFAENSQSTKDIFLLKAKLDQEDEGLKISSTSYDIKNAYSQFMSAFSKALFIFTLICFIGVSLILAVTSLSSFIEKKKESAVLSCLGADNRSIMSIFLKENIYLIVTSVIVSFALSFVLQFLINFGVNRNYNLNNIISIPFLKWLNIPLLFPLLLFLIVLLVSFIFVAVPLYFYKNISITDELRDE